MQNITKLHVMYNHMWLCSFHGKFRTTNYMYQYTTLLPASSSELNDEKVIFFVRGVVSKEDASYYRKLYWTSMNETVVTLGDYYSLWVGDIIKNSCSSPSSLYSNDYHLGIKTI